MPVKIEIQDDDIKYLNEQATKELNSSVKKFADDLITEASRLEAGDKTTTGNPEITSSHVNDARLLIRRGYIKPKKPIWLKVTQIVAVLGGIVTGLLADFDILKKPEMLLIFIGVLVITITATVLIVVKE